MQIRRKHNEFCFQEIISRYEHEEFIDDKEETGLKKQVAMICEGGCAGSAGQSIKTRVLGCTG